jgi:hypothetical protein
MAAQTPGRNRWSCEQVTQVLGSPADRLADNCLSTGPWRPQNLLRQGLHRRCPRHHLLLLMGGAQRATSAATRLGSTGLPGLYSAQSLV